MTKAGGAGSDDLRIREYKIRKDQAGEQETLTLPKAKQLVESFALTSQPLTQPVAPNGVSDFAEARSQVLQRLDVNMQAALRSENAAKRSALAQKLSNLGGFVKKHPWLTVGFTVAFIMAFVTAYLTVQAFLGHQTIALFGAHPELGGGISFMLIYYTVYLVNLCRRSAHKDELEDKIHTINEAVQESQEVKTGELNRLITNLNANIMKLGVTLLESERANQESLAAVQKQYDSAVKAQEHIKQLQGALRKLATQNKALTPEDKEVLLPAIENAAIAINKGAEIMRAFALAHPEAPLIPQMELSTTVVDIPLIVTDKMRAHQSKQKPFAERMGNLFATIGPTLKNNPGSIGLFATGIGMCVLSGVAVFFYFHGDTNLYFFGSLSLMTIAPMAMYGISLLYEGYNNATIGVLQDELKETEQRSQERAAALEEEKEKLNKLRDRAVATSAQFTEKLAAFQKLQSETLSKALSALNIESYGALKQAEGQVEAVVRQFQKLFSGEEFSEEIHRVVQDTVAGANLFAH